jgi:TatD DNase family protein
LDNKHRRNNFHLTIALLIDPANVDTLFSMIEKTIPLIDCHLHLQDPRFSPDLEAVFTRAKNMGVEKFVCNGTCETDWPAVAELAENHPQVIPCFGLHPWYVKDRSADWLGRLETFLDHMPGGVGEIGLDRWIEDRDDEAQEEVFRAQLDLARKKRRPVMIHCLRAWGRLMEILREEKPLTAGMLIHAYGGPAELVAELTAMGAYISFAGTVLEPKRSRTLAAMMVVPRDRLLLETDAPDLSPPKEFCLNENRNEPGNLRAILTGVSAILNENEMELAESLWQNGQRFLNG